MTRKKILIADDSKTALLMEQMMLRKEPYEVMVAGNGEEAVEKALSQRPDLILLDVMMPKMGGFDALKRLRSEQATKETPVILVTTLGENQNVQKGYEYGCNDYLTKPVDGPELLEKVRKHLGSR